MHVLRDLGLWSDAGGETPRAGLALQPAIWSASGACSAGALAVLVDVVAGGAALRAAERAEPAGERSRKGLEHGASGGGGPAQRAEGERSRIWIATSDLRVHWLRAVRDGELVASARPLRSGRGSVVLEVEVEAGGELVAHGTVGFARLEAKGGYQQRPREFGAGRIDWGARGAGFERPWAERIGVCVRDAAAGELELTVTPYVGNSLGGLQGGVSVALVDFAAEAAAGARFGPGLATRDLAVHFLALGRRGPMRTRVEPLRRDAEAALLRVEVRDAGAGDRLCTLATATMAR